MSIRNLEHLFRPRSVAVVGASTRPHSVGGTVMRNLLHGDFPGPVMPVNPHHESVGGVLAYADVASLPVAPDLAVICTPPRTVPEVVAALGERGTRAAVVLTAGLQREHDESGRTLQQAMLEAARPHLLRILGPNCLGVLVPGRGLNASFAHTDSLPGRVALVHQSGALCTALLDWARSNGIGFSHFVSIGDGADVDFGDALDYLGGEPDAHAILLYIEAIRGARKFMSAARAAARNKPVLVIKAGRATEGAAAAATHTGALAGADEVYDAAIRRAGMLRVFDTDELLDAVETLARPPPRIGDRLAILTNGGGPGVIATDALVLGGGSLARLSEETVRRLDEVLPATWSRRNPVDIIGDADGERYRGALSVLLDDAGVDAVLVLHSPTAIASPVEAARAVTGVVAEREARRERRRWVLTSWLGGDAVAESRRVFGAAGIPSYDTPDGAVRAFMHLVSYARNQEMLLETPPSTPAGEHDTQRARRVLHDALEAGREMLTAAEARDLLEAYAIPAVETRLVSTAGQAAQAARETGFPVALKLHSPEVSHKSDVGGVVLDLEDAEAVCAAAKAMAERLARLRPDARLAGFTVQGMARKPGAHELIVGVSSDPVFGPVILFGQGGTAVEIIADRSLALPPLNLALARDLVARTRIADLLRGYRDRPAADLEAICMTLVRVSQIAVDCPDVVELDINPLLADERGVLAVDARVHVAPAPGAPTDRLAICPYPVELEETLTLPSGTRLLLRPIRPEDEPAHHRFVQALSSEDKRLRFFGSVRDLPHSQLARLTQIDYDREMAFIAVPADDGKTPETLAVVRIVSDPDRVRAEFAIIVRSDRHGEGIGRALLAKMIRYCRERGTRTLEGDVLRENERMIGLARSFGFQRAAGAEVGTVHVTLELAPD